MKLHHLILLVCVATGLLSGCAYMEGRKDQQNAVANKPTTGRVIRAQEPVQPSPNKTANPSATASQMIAPIVQ